ncbi:MAG TPA: hypothetical protein VK448_07610 [Dissulfurispiraceae bacterium]|nr:hypothetical protein [Dissulfurispiraceae bacterium]
MVENGIPPVEKMSALITALKLYVEGNSELSGACRSPHAFDVPILGCWDALDWYGLVPDVEVVAYLISGSKESRRSLRSLQSFVQWQVQSDVDQVCEKIRMGN